MRAVTQYSQHIKAIFELPPEFRRTWKYFEKTLKFEQNNILSVLIKLLNALDVFKNHSYQTQQIQPTPNPT